MGYAFLLNCFLQLKKLSNALIQFTSNHNRKVICMLTQTSQSHYPEYPSRVSDLSRNPHSISPLCIHQSSQIIHLLKSEHLSEQPFTSLRKLLSLCTQPGNTYLAPKIWLQNQEGEKVCVPFLHKKKARLGNQPVIG